MDWLAFKNEASRLLLDKDALHIYAALAIQLAAAKLSRRTVGHLLPWFAVLGIELVNEWIDLLRGRETVIKPWQIVSAVHDIVNTMILPTLLLLLCRKNSELFQWPGKSADKGCTSANVPVTPISSSPPPSSLGPSAVEG